MRLMLWSLELKRDIGNSGFLWVVALRIIGEDREERFFFSFDMFLYYWNYFNPHACIPFIKLFDSDHELVCGVVELYNL